jgi:hypothetical protein
LTDFGGKKELLFQQGLQPIGFWPFDFAGVLHL